MVAESSIARPRRYIISRARVLWFILCGLFLLTHVQAAAADNEVFVDAAQWGCYGGGCTVYYQLNDGSVLPTTFYGEAFNRCDTNPLPWGCPSTIYSGAFSDPCSGGNCTWFDPRYPVQVYINDPYGCGSVWMPAAYLYSSQTPSCNYECDPDDMFYTYPTGPWPQPSQPGDSFSQPAVSTTSYNVGQVITLRAADASGYLIDYYWNGAFIATGSSNSPVPFTIPNTPGTFSLMTVTHGGSAGSCGGPAYISVTNTQTITVLGPPVTTIALNPPTPNGLGGFWLNATATLTCTPQSANCSHTYYQVSTDNGVTYGATQTHTWGGGAGAEVFTTPALPNGRLKLKYWSDDIAGHTEIP